MDWENSYWRATILSEPIDHSLGLYLGWPTTYSLDLHFFWSLWLSLWAGNPRPILDLHPKLAHDLIPLNFSLGWPYPLEHHCILPLPPGHHHVGVWLNARLRCDRQLPKKCLPFGDVKMSLLPYFRPPRREMINTPLITTFAMAHGFPGGQGQMWRKVQVIGPSCLQPPRLVL